MNGRDARTKPAVIDVPLLTRLLESPEPQTLDALAAALRVSNTDVARGIGQLQRAGCRFETHPRRGVRLLESGLGGWTDYLEAASDRPRLVACYRSTSSTQDVCRRLVESRGRDADGALITADEQTAGRGRLGRSWIAPPGSGIAMSLAHHGDAARGTTDRLTFATSIAVARAAERVLPGHAVTIKWPNDIYLDGRKLAGILVETLAGPHGRAAVIGIGMNVRLHAHDLPEDLRTRVTSLALHGCVADRLLVLAELVRELDRVLATRADELIPEWRARCRMLGQRAAFQTHGQPVTGEVLDLDPHLGLIVRTDDGRITHLPAATTSVVV